MFGALFLAVLATLPTVFYKMVGLSLPLAASSLLIAVSVAIETARQLQSQMDDAPLQGLPEVIESGGNHDESVFFLALPARARGRRRPW